MVRTFFFIFQKKCNKKNQFVISPSSPSPLPACGLLLLLNDDKEEEEEEEVVVVEEEEEEEEAAAEELPRLAARCWLGRM